MKGCPQNLELRYSSKAIEQEIESFLDNFHELFVRFWFDQHNINCKKHLNCKSISKFIVIVICLLAKSYLNLCNFQVVTDGNEKCRRLRCFSDDGHLNMNDTLIHTGCDASPLRNSYFCEIHKSGIESVSIIELEDKY